MEVYYENDGNASAGRDLSIMNVKLVEKRRLSLFLDMDLTMLHSTVLPVSEYVDNVYHYRLEDERQYHTKLRPHLDEFLEQMATMYEMSILYDMGNRCYADKIREFIDPHKELFGPRTISFHDALKRSLDKTVVILDDRLDLWTQNANVIQVRPFIFFPNVGDINDHRAARGGRNMAREVAVHVVGEGEDDYLNHLGVVLSEIHARYFAEADGLGEELGVLSEEPEVYEQHELSEQHGAVTHRGRIPDVKDVMRRKRAEVLRGCRVTFSGLTGSVRETPEYHVLSALGGHHDAELQLPPVSRDLEIGDFLGPLTTHLVSHSYGTKKEHQVDRYNCAVGSDSESYVQMVNVYWIWECYFLWTRADEAQFRSRIQTNREIRKLCAAPPVAASDGASVEYCVAASVGATKKKAKCLIL